jgi:hypothetical protein
MPKSKHCGDPNDHAPHKYLGPSEDPNKTTQVSYKCPGGPAKKRPRRSR